MKKTRYMATIVQSEGWTVRRVYADEEGKHSVRINGSWYEVDFLKSHGRKVTLWQD